MILEKLLIKKKMNQKEFRLQKEIRDYDKYFKIDSVVIDELEDGKFTTSYTRYKLSRPDAVALLVFNKDTNKVILVKQFRYPIANRESENILEVVAGKIDGDESPKTAAVRELEEEIGYSIKEERLSNSLEMFASPGYSTEKIHIFLAIVEDSDKTSNGGGVAGEHENIEIVEIDLNEFMSKVRSNEIKDAKTIIASTLIKL